MKEELEKRMSDACDKIDFIYTEDDVCDDYPALFSECSKVAIQFAIEQFQQHIDDIRQLMNFIGPTDPAWYGHKRSIVSLEAKITELKNLLK